MPSLIFRGNKNRGLVYYTFNVMIWNRTIDTSIRTKTGSGLMKNILKSKEYMYSGKNSVNSNEIMA